MLEACADNQQHSQCDAKNERKKVNTAQIEGCFGKMSGLFTLPLLQCIRIG